MTQNAFTIVDGHGLSTWREDPALAAPGGRTPILNWAKKDDHSHTINYTYNAAEEPYSDRWTKAQNAEKTFWRSWRKNPLYRDVEVSPFWQDVAGKTGGPLPQGKVLDLGCGPCSILNFIRHPQCLPIGLDPLADFYQQEQLVEHDPQLSPVPLIALPAEALPFQDHSLDHVLCFNVLDHVADAPSVLREIKRVLKHGGTLRVYVHTFAPWIKHFLIFDTPHTYHWDHAQFRRLVETHGFITLNEEHEPKNFELPRGMLARLRYLPYWVATKVAATSYFQFQVAPK